VSEQPAPRRAGNAGFTLIEVMLAMAVMAMVVALALPLSGRSSQTALRVKAFEIATFLRSSRNEAIRTGAATRVLIDGDARILSSLPPRWTAVVPEPFQLVPDGVGRTLEFYSNGRASGGTIFVGLHQKGFAITINRLTAAIDVVAY